MPPPGPASPRPATTQRSAETKGITVRGAVYDFDYAMPPRFPEWVALLEGADGKILSTRNAGGFVGLMLGMFAHGR